MAYYDSRFVSHTNHTLNHSRSALARAPAVRPYPQFQVSMPVTYFDYSQPLPSSRLAPHYSQFMSAANDFNTPLLQPSSDYVSDLQSVAPVIRPALPSWYQLAHPGLANTVSNDAKLHVKRPVGDVLPTIHMPVPTPATHLRSALYSMERSCAPHHEADNAEEPAQLLPRSLQSKAESTPLRLEDVINIPDAISLPDADRLTGVSQANRNMRASSSSRSVSESAYSMMPSIDFMAPAWSRSSATPPLSLGSASGSEETLPSFPQKMLMDDLLRLSCSPALKIEEISPKLSSSPIGIYVDVNMREQGIRDRPEPVCIEPSTVMSDSLKMYCASASPSPPPTPTSALLPPHSEPGQLPMGFDTTRITPSRTSDFHSGILLDQEFPEDAISAIVSVLRSSTGDESPDPSSASAGPSITALPPHMFTKAPETTEIPLAPSLEQDSHLTVQETFTHSSVTPAIRGDCLALAPSMAAGLRIPLTELRVPQVTQTSSAYEYPPAAYSLRTVHSFSPAPILPELPRGSVLTSQPVPSSPVLNAHAGVSLADLSRRAHDFRMRNPGAELDKAFLQSFAGRLSARGELLSDYRCYVTGCGQRNKRRDHILVHVGSHVEHRPWACSHWCVLSFIPAAGAGTETSTAG